MKTLALAVLLASTGCAFYATTPDVAVGVGPVPVPAPVVVYERPWWHGPRYVGRPYYARPYATWSHDNGRHRGWYKHGHDRD